MIVKEIDGFLYPHNEVNVDFPVISVSFKPPRPGTEPRAL